MTTITLNKTNTNTVAKMIESGKTFNQIQTAMVALDIVASAKDAEEYLNSVGVEKGKKRGFVDQMHAYLEAEPRTQADFYAWLLENGSDNVWRWRKQHDKVRELAVNLHVKLSGIEFTEVRYVDKTKDAA